MYIFNGEGATKPEDVKVVEGKVDECAVRLFLYEDELNDEGKNIPLNGHNINELLVSCCKSYVG